jgi:N-acylneuraminate cytidylyltransferase
MIAWSIKAAQDSELFERIIVSTDDTEISEISREYGAEVPFIRPDNIADDYTGTTDVVAHAIRWLIDHEQDMNAVCCLYATAPYVRFEDIRRGLDLLESGKWAFTFAATEYASSIFRSFHKLAEGGVEMFFPEYLTSRSQDLPVALHDAGLFYWGWPDSWLKLMSIFDQHSYPINIPRWRVHDIDTEEDWLRAELMWTVVSGNKNV